MRAGRAARPKIVPQARLPLSQQLLVARRTCDAETRRRSDTPTSLYQQPFARRPRETRQPRGRRPAVPPLPAAFRASAVERAWTGPSLNRHFFPLAR